MSYEGTDMPDNDAQEQSSHRRVAERVDPVSVVAGLVFIAIALASLIDRYWAEVDAAVVFGASIVAIGMALMVSVVLRHRRREQHDGGLPG